MSEDRTACKVQQVQAIRQEMRPTMRILLPRPVQRGHGSHFTTGSRYSIQAVLNVPREDDEPVWTPCGSARRGHIRQHLHRGGARAKIGGHFLHLSSSEEPDEPAVWRPEWLKSTFRASEG